MKSKIFLQILMANVFAYSLQAQDPATQNIAAQVLENKATVIPLTCASDTSLSTFAVVLLPSHGTVTNPLSTAFSSATLIYVPHDSYTGSDSFEVAVVDSSTGLVKTLEHVDVTVVAQNSLKTLSNKSGALANGFGIFKGQIIAVEPNNTKGYVVDQDSISVVNLDKKSRSYLKVIGLVKDLVPATLNLPESIAFSADGLQAYVANTASGDVSVIDVASNAVVSKLSGYTPVQVSSIRSGATLPNILSTDVIVNAADHSITVTSTDAGGQAVSFSLDGLHPCITKGYQGQDCYSCSLNNGIPTKSPSGQMQIRVVSASPTANPQAVGNVVVNSIGNAITLTGVDQANLSLTFNVPATSSYGMITQAAVGSASLTYMPLPGYVGQDSFTFTVTNSSGLTSAPAVVTISVTDTPIANTLFENVIINSVDNQITLTGMDPLGQAFTFALASAPKNGTVSGFNPYTGIVNYTPNTGFVGQDSFTFAVTNTPAGITSAAGTVTITVSDTPVANAQSANFVVNSSNNAITLSGTDPLGTALTYMLGVGTGPSNGTLNQAVYGSADVTYTPNDGFIGEDSFVFSVVNAAGVVSAPAVVTIAVSDTPIANSRFANIEVNSANTTIVLTGSDPLGESLTFALGTNPSNGTLSGFNSSTGQVTYTPNAGYLGKDTFTFMVKNAPYGIISAPATVSIAVTDNPFANAQSVSFAVNSTNNFIILSGTDPLAQGLSYAILPGTGPSYGTISAFNPATGLVIYTPNNAYVGQDSFAFTVTNSSGITSAPARVTITLTDTPVANSRSANVGVNSVGNAIVLTGFDPLGQTFMFGIENGTGPAHGSLSAFNESTGQVTYTPNAGFVGQDSFAFTVTNSDEITSAPALVTISVIDIPVAAPRAVNVGVNSVNNQITVTGIDPLGQVLVFGLQAGPSHGALVSFDAKAGVATYTPAAKFVGQDSFAFTVTNTPAGITSAPAVVTISVTDTPVAVAQSANVVVNSSNNLITLSGKDPLGQGLTFGLELGTGPSYGTLSGFNTSTGTVIYTPNNFYAGKDSFMFTVTNSSGVTSAPVVVNINVIDTPVANARSANVVANSTVNTIALTGSDPLGQVCTFALGANPSHGTVSGLNPSTGLVNYTPTAGYVGKDSFTFTLTNSSGATSAPATVSVIVTDTPAASAQSAIIQVNANSTPITLSGKDPLSQALIFALVNGTGPSNGLVSGFNAKTGVVYYMPNHGYIGSDAFMFTVTNSSGVTSPAATVKITVADTPSALAQSVSVAQNSTGTSIVLAGKDPLGQLLTFAVVTNPANGSLSVFNPNTHSVTYTPVAGYTGTDTFTFTVTNSSGIVSAPATVTITVK